MGAGFKTMMLPRFNSLSVPLLAAAMASSWAVVSAQDLSPSQAADDVGLQQPADDGAAPTVIRNPVLIMDSPMPLEQNIDPIQSQPFSLVAPEDDPEFLGRANSINQYSTTVQNIELEGGAWDRSLVQELMSMGNLFQQQGAYLEAAEVQTRAMHVNRINSGLHTLEQIPAVEELIESYIALGDWEQADLYHEYLFYVQQKAYGLEDPRMIPVLDSLAKWNLQAFNVGYGEALGLRLTNAQLLFRAAARMVQVHFGKQDARFVSYLKSLAGSSYLVYRNPQLIAEARRPEYRTTQDMLREKLNEIGPVNARGFDAGEAAILDIIDHYRTQGSVYELAESQVFLGDWYLLFERRRAARDQYNQAWQLLGAEEDGEQLQQRLFGEVEPLPSFNANQTIDLSGSQKPQEAASLNYGYADIMMDVISTGGVRNVRVLTEETELNSAILNRLKRRVRGSLFRPLVVDGKPVSSTDHRFRYRYWY